MYARAGPKWLSVCQYLNLLLWGAYIASVYCFAALNLGVVSLVLANVLAMSLRCLLGLQFIYYDFCEGSLAPIGELCISFISLFVDRSALTIFGSVGIFSILHRFYVSWRLCGGVAVLVVSNSQIAVFDVLHEILVGGVFLLASLLAANKQLLSLTNSFYETK